ncbi:MAG: N-acetylmuramoyl-L-alanine amidase [Pseudomonadota bacterium]
MAESRFFSALALVAVLVLAPLANAQDRLAITGFQQSARGDDTILRFAFDRPAEPRIFTLTEPYRVVVDLPPFGWTAVPPETAEPVLSVRHGLFRSDVGRIVVEMSGPVAVQPHQTAEGLALTLRPIGATAFARTAGWPEDARWEVGGPRTIGRAAADGDIVIAIDPGHGGIDPGAMAEGLVEKHIVLRFSSILANEINAIPGLTAVKTRTDDRFLPLRERIRLAREAGAHAMLSIHADSLAEGRADGVSVYTLSRFGTDQAADAFAERENRADVLAGVNLAGNEDDVTRLLIDLARRGTKAESVKLADALIASLAEDVALLDTRPHRRGNFFVLKAPDLPSVLVELGFLSSEKDRERLTDPIWQTRTTRALIRGLQVWFETASPGFLTPRG